MRAFIPLLLVVVVACTRPNPNRCCTDEADCIAKDIPVGNTCEPGLLCRGNQCISQPCSNPSQCDDAAPYCVADLCAESCAEDAHCPGFAESAAELFCVGGDCVTCRDSADCGDETPVCESGGCRACASHDECGSQVCEAGHCVASTKIAYAKPDGSTTSSCTQPDPCTMERALYVIDVTRNVIKLLPGTYSLAVPEDLQWGFRGAFELSVYGPATLASPISMDRPPMPGALRLRDLSSTSLIYCDGIDSVLDLDRVTVTHPYDEYASSLIVSSYCRVWIRNSEIRTVGKPTAALYITGINGTAHYHAVIERSTLVATGGPAGTFNVIAVGINAGVQITNSVLIGGSQYYPTVKFHNDAAPSSFIRFSTLWGTAQHCEDGTLPLMTVQNSIIANTSANAPADLIAGNRCTFANNLVKPQSTAIGTNNLRNLDPRFADTAAGDFHLIMGSPAIDKADPGATEPVDFDGTPRPQGAARDIGAFEYKPN
jgi:hypothetical protein